MNDIDRQIREALGRDAPPGADDLSMLAQVGEAMRGRNRWLAIYSIIVGVIFMGATVFTAWKFFTVEDQRAMLAWGAGCAFCLLAVFGMKVWYWMELQKNAVVREVKRVELQIARLAESIAQRP